MAKPYKKQHKKAPVRETSSVIKWFRGIGCAAILLSMVGLLQLFFWSSVILFYFGLAIALIDLFYEKLPRSSTFLFAVIILGIAALFTWKVVMRKDPIVAYYFMADNGFLRVHVTNTSDADYRDLDFKINQDYPDNFVVDGKEVSNLGGLKVLDPHYSSTQEKDDRFSVTEDPLHPGTLKWEGNFLRFQCDKLSRETGIEFTMGLERTMSDGKTVETVTRVNKIILQGTYRGQFREYSIAQEAIDFRKSPKSVPFN